jgi:3-dehydroquinate dehydratase I
MRTVPLRDVVLGQGGPKVIVPLVADRPERLLDEAAALAGHDVDVVEWRVDHLAGSPGAADVLAACRALVPALGGRPLLATFRTAAEGGARALDDGAYADLAVALAGSGLVDAIDLELARAQDETDRALAAARAAGVAVVMSNHDFAGTPARDEIVARLRRMQDRGADVCKIAVMPHDAGDVLTLLDATWTMRSRYADRPLVTMAMGDLGVASRIAGGVFGSAATFGTVGPSSAPGQVPVERLRQVLDLLGR